jgi:urease accessory protein
MADPAALLAALQLSDSALPIGRFVHSYGVESWLRERGEVAPGELADLVRAAVCESIAPLDGAVLAHAQRASSIAELVRLDDCISARKLTPSARHASQTCGRQLAALAPQLAPSSELVADLSERVRSGQTDGNLAVVQGALARALGIPALDAVLVELRSAAAGLVSAAVRLGALSPVRAQVIVAELAPALVAAAESAIELGLDELSATAPELELAALAHSRADARMFAT